MTLPDIPEPLTPDQEEILITLRALAGLVAHALRRKVALDVATQAAAVAQASIAVCAWRDVLRHETRRLLPRLNGSTDAAAADALAEQLVRDVYLADRHAIAHHGCDPLTCTHPAHERV